MAEGKQIDAWRRTSELLAMLYNTHASKNPMRAEHFMPPTLEDGDDE